MALVSNLARRGRCFLALIAGVGAAAGPMIVEAAPLGATPGSVTQVVRRAGAAVDVTITLDSPSGPATWTATSTHASIRPTAAGTAPGPLTITFDPGTLPAGEVTAAVTVQSGTDSLNVPVTMRILDLSIRKLVADLERPVVYGVHAPPGGQGMILFIDDRTAIITKAVAVGNDPIDVGIDYRTRQLYVPNYDRRQLRLVSLDSGQVTSTLNLSVSGTTANAVVPGTILVGTPGDPVFVNAATGAVMSTIGPLVAAGGGSFVELSGRYLYEGQRYGGGYHRVDLTTVPPTRTDTFFAGFFAVPTGPSADGSRVGYYNTVYDSFFKPIVALPEPIAVLSYRGERAFSEGSSNGGFSHVYAVPSGDVLLSLPYRTSVAAFSGDQHRLIVFDENPATRLLEVHDLPGPPLLPPGAMTTPAAEATVVLPLASLRWDTVPSALGYGVYFGTSQAEVAAATPASPLYLGETRDSFMAAPGGLAPGQMYFWRIDAVTPAGAASGAVRRFGTLPLELNPASVEGSGVAGAAAVPIAVSIATAEGVEWHISESTPWLTVEPASGVGSGQATFMLSPAGLAKNVFNASATISVGGQTTDIPVRFDVRALNLVKLDGRPGAGFVYGINNDAGVGHVVAINPATAGIEKSAPVTDHPSDLDVTATGVYVICGGGGGAIHRLSLDLVASDVRRLAGAPLTASGDSRVAAAAADRVYWRDETEFKPLIHTLDFDSGVETAPPVLLPGPAATGGSLGASDIGLAPDGLSLFATSSSRYWSNVGSALVNLTLTPALAVGESSPSVLSNAPAAVVPAELSHFVFAGDRCFDTGDLQHPVALFPSSIIAATGDALLAMTNRGLFRGLDARFIANLPVTTEIMATDGANWLVYFASGELKTFSLAPYGSLSSDPPDGAVLAQMPSALSVPASPGTVAYSFYLGTVSTEVATADPTSPTFLGTVPVPTMPLAIEGSPLVTYYWRVDRDSQRGAIHRFQVRAQEVDRIVGSFAYGNYAADGDDLLIASTNPFAVKAEVRFFQRVPGGDHFSPTDLRTGGLNLNSGSPAIKGDDAWVGAERDGPFEAGAAYYFHRGAAGLWPQAGRFTATPLGDSENWGTSLAAGDTYLAVGVPGYNTNVGCVDVVNPTTGARLIRLTVPGATNYDWNGKVVAASGPWIAAQGYGRIGGNRQSAVKIFRRGAAWAYQATIGRPNVTDEDSEFGSALALDGDTLAVAGGSAAGRFVQIYSLTPTGPTLLQQIDAPPSDTDSYFGQPLAMRHGVLAISAYKDISGQVRNAGKVHLYRKPVAPATLWEPLAPVEVEQPLDTNLGLGFRLALSDRYLFAFAPYLAGNYSVAVFLLDPDANRAPWIETTVPPDAEVGQELAWAVGVRDEDPGDTVTLTAAELPAFLTLTEGSLRGTPTAAGSFNVILTATDSRGGTRNQSYVLPVAAAGRVPTLTKLPAPAAVTAGAPLVLSADASTSVSVTWQWFLDGRAVPGATQKTLSRDHAHADDAGEWFVRMIYPTGHVDSPPVTVTVAPSTNRFAGDWMTLGRDAGHTSYYPAAFGTHTWRRKWKVSAGTGPLWETAISDGRVLVANQAEAGSPTLKALNVKTGTALWSGATPSRQNQGGPTATRFQVYIERPAIGGSYQVALQAMAPDTGAVVWTQEYVSYASGARYAPPAVRPDAIHFLTTGHYGAVDESGTWRFFNETSTSTDGEARLTPSVSDQGAGTWQGGTFDFFDALTGNRLWSVTPVASDRSSAGVPVMSDDIAVVRSATRIEVIDLANKRVRWSRPNANATLPAVHDGEIYLIEGSSVLALSAADGSVRRTYPAEPFEPATGFQPMNHPVITDDLVIAATPGKSFIFDRQSAAVHSTLPDGGVPALYDGYLLLAGRDGALAAYYAGQAPEVQPADRTLAATEDQPFTWSLRAVDSDGDVPSLAVVSKPDWLAATAGGQGVLNFAGTPAQRDTGTASLTVRTSDPTGDSAITTLVINVAEVNDPPTAAAPRSLITDEDLPATLNLLSPPLASDEEDGTALAWRVTGVSEAGLVEASVSAAGILTVSPLPDRFGEATVNLVATDSGGLTVAAEVMVTIRPVNDAPVAAPVTPVVAAEDSPPIVLSLVGIFTDVDDAANTLARTITAFPAAGIVQSATIVGDEVILPLVANASGATAITVRATDAGGLFAEATWSIIVTPVPDAPVAPAVLPPVVATDDGAPVSIALAGFFADADPGDVLTFALVNNTNSGLFALVGIDPATGVLTATFAPYAWGQADLTVRATDTDGLFVETVITLTLPALPPPVVRVEGAPAVNPQTGLIEQVVMVKNVGARAMGGFDLNVPSLPAGVELFNSSGQHPDGSWFVRYGAPVAAGAEVRVVLEYYSPSRRTIGLPDSFTAEPIIPVPVAPGAADPAGVTVDRVLLRADGALVEFRSRPGQRYKIQWSADGQAWKTSATSLRAGGTRTQWIDRGPPRTDISPLLERQRFYRVSEIAE